MDGGEEVSRQFIEAGCDTPKLFELAEESLDQVALSVDGGVDAAPNDAP
jgi:hypothetical protein